MENRPLDKEHSIEPAHDNDTAHREGLPSSHESSQDTVSSHNAPGGKAPKKTKSSKASGKQESEPSAAIPPSVPVRNWFVTFMCMNIPVVGWIYLIILACSRTRSPKKDFAKAYLLYKLVFLLLSLAILAVAVYYGLELLDKLLAYMEML